MEETPDPLLEAAEDFRDLLHGHFSPAKDEGDATMFLSTQQIHALLQGHVPEKYPITIVADLMRIVGFKEASSGGTWYWLLRSPE